MTNRPGTPVHVALKRRRSVAGRIGDPEETERKELAAEEKVEETLEEEEE
jgi:hypothetical protein